MVVPVSRNKPPLRIFPEKITVWPFHSVFCVVFQQKISRKARRVWPLRVGKKAIVGVAWCLPPPTTGVCSRRCIIHDAGGLPNHLWEFFFSRSPRPVRSDRLWRDQSSERDVVCPTLTSSPSHTAAYPPPGGCCGSGGVLWRCLPQR